MCGAMVNQPLPPGPWAAPGRLGPGRRVYVVGDVHGCAGALSALHHVVENDLAERPINDGCPAEDGPCAPLLLHLGDLIDRGPDSASVVARLAAGPPIPGVPTINLMGNHEWMMLAALSRGDTEAQRIWLENGGYEALRSWGVPAQARPEDWPALLPPEHLAFLRDLAPWHQLDGYLFAHAGVRPGVNLEQQRWADLLWIREPFLSWDGPMLPSDPDVVIVHGHTVSAAPVLRPNRLGVDTGSGRGGMLTCAVLEGSHVRFLNP